MAFHARAVGQVPGRLARWRGGRDGLMTVEEALAEASAGLTEGCITVEDVAARLKAAQCEGKRGNPVKCPLAMWFGAALRKRGALSPRQVVLVDGTTWGRAYLYVHVRGVASREPDACPAVLAPTLLVQFASKFDSGSFPELTR
jgi:hypothetical protein